MKKFELVSKTSNILADIYDHVSDAMEDEYDLLEDADLLIENMKENNTVLVEDIVFLAVKETIRRTKEF